MKRHALWTFAGAAVGLVLAALLALLIPTGRVDYAFVGDDEGSALLDFAGPIVPMVGVVAGAVAGLLVSRRRSRRS